VALTNAIIANTVVTIDDNRFLSIICVYSFEFKSVADRSADPTLPIQMHDQRTTQSTDRRSDQRLPKALIGGAINDYPKH